MHVKYPLPNIYTHAHTHTAWQQQDNLFFSPVSYFLLLWHVNAILCPLIPHHCITEKQQTVIFMTSL